MITKQTQTSKIHWGIHLAIWTALGLFWATRLYSSYNSADHIVPWTQTTLWGLLDWYAWGALSPLVIYFSRRWPLERNRWLVSLPIHLLLSLILAPVQLAIFTRLFIWVGGLEYIMTSLNNPSFGIVLENMLYGKIHSSMLVYWGILFVYSMSRYYREYRSERLRSADMETRLAQAELAALRMQLQPHFLFNTLNTISALMREDINQAETMIARLGDLLRATLERGSAAMAPLSDEITFLRRYLEIESVRYQDRLTIEFEIDDEALPALTPGLILQPLVENAIKHGIAPKERDGVISISALVRNGMLELTVSDNGLGFSNDWRKTADSRVGLSNTEARLRQSYSSNHTFSAGVNPDTGSGAQVKISIPFQLAHDSTAAGNPEQPE